MIALADVLIDNNFLQLYSELACRVQVDGVVLVHHCCFFIVLVFCSLFLEAYDSVVISSESFISSYVNQYDKLIFILFYGIDMVFLITNLYHQLTMRSLISYLWFSHVNICNFMLSTVKSITNVMTQTWECNVISDN